MSSEEYERLMVERKKNGVLRAKAASL